MCVSALSLLALRFLLMLGAQGAFPHLKIHFGGPSGGPKKKKKHMLQRNHRTKEEEEALQQ
jgi:hypothetical protein